MGRGTNDQEAIAEAGFTFVHTLLGLTPAHQSIQLRLRDATGCSELYKAHEFVLACTASYLTCCVLDSNGIKQAGVFLW